MHHRAVIALIILSSGIGRQLGQQPTQNPSTTRITSTSAVTAEPKMAINECGTAEISRRGEDANRKYLIAEAVKDTQEASGLMNKGSLTEDEKMRLDHCLGSANEITELLWREAHEAVGGVLPIQNASR